MGAELPVITERGEITIGDRVVATYALWEDINETIKSVLAKHGFALSFRTGCEEHAIVVTAVLDHKDGHQEATCLRLPPDVGPERNAVQAVGSTVSYGKRYTACALLNLNTKGEDDDGRRAAGGLVTPQQIKVIEARIEGVKANRKRFLRYLKVEAIDKIPAARFDEALSALTAKTLGVGGVQ